MTDLPPIPLMLRTRLAHATLQAIADDCGAEILHIKGAAVDASLLPIREDAPADATAAERALPRLSADADVLVRPAHLKRFLAALKRHGWIRKSRLYSGGAVEHSVDWWQPELGGVDVHVRFPGIRLAPERAFTKLWRDRTCVPIAHRACHVPTVDAQRLVLLLHAARNGGPDGADVGLAWANATPAERKRVRELATSFDAEVALAGATGHLDDYADRPEYDLWRLLGQTDAEVFELWVSMVKAGPTNFDRVRAILYALQPKGDRLAPDLQRQSAPIEVLHAHIKRLQRGGAGVLGLAYRATSHRLPRRRTPDLERLKRHRRSFLSLCLHNHQCFDRDDPSSPTER